MIVRTYKRRSRGDLLGSQGSAGDRDDDGLGVFAGRFSEEDDLDSTFWSSWQHPSSQGSSGVDDEEDPHRFSSSPTHKPQLLQELEKISKATTTDSANGKLGGRSTSAGQKLIRAENLLKKAKTSSNSSLKSGSTRTVVTSGDSRVCQTENDHSKVGVTDFDVEGHFKQRTDKANLTSGNDLEAKVTKAPEEDELKSMAVSAQILSVIGPCAPPTSTLLEAQESGEMMEHVDEVNFAMDGLRPGQPLRICRASLISLLSIFGTRQHRRLLRTHGMVKPVLDAVLTVPTDDSATALAAAALLYVIANDGQDADFLDSPACIQFLMKLLNPVSCSAQDKRLSLLGNRLLALGTRSKSNKADAQAPMLDQGGLLLVNKVKYLLSSMKGRSDGIPKLDNESASFPEEAISSEWLVLLTLEKACLSTVVLEDNAGSVRRVGGYFKERLRELGGLNTVCEMAANCFSNLRKTRSKTDYQQQNTLLEGSRGAGVLLRCLRVMENVTFLSENNQKFLLEMILTKSGVESPSTFLEVVIGTINMISGFILSRNRTEQKCHGAKVKKAIKMESFSLPKPDGKVSGAGGRDTRRSSGLSLEGGKAKGSFDFDDLDGSSEKDTICNQLSKQQKGQAFAKRETCKVTSSQIISSENCDTNMLTEESHDDLLENCLLSAVKVLMNLTNDNDLGCRQVAAVGGLDAMASLIVRHFPSFHSFPLDAQATSGKCKANEKITGGSRLVYQDQDLDLLVVVLGVLVNLVEKDSRNRGRLISLNTADFKDTLDASVVRKHSIIKLLCSIFLSKEGAGRAIESNKSNCASESDTENNFKQEQQEAENMILEAYSALLLAFLSKESLNVRRAIAQHLPEQNLSALVPVLERFLDFHLSLNMLSSDTHETVREVIESCKIT